MCPIIYIKNIMLHYKKHIYIYYYITYICYLPPAASSRGDKSHDVFDTLRCQCLKFQDKGEILICGDFNARIGSLNDMSDVTQTRLPQRQIIDYTTNSHGKQLIDFLRDCNMVTLNGRFSSDKDNFTVISSVGKSVVDYAIVQADHFRNYSNFQVKTVLDILEYYSIPSDSPMPDHSLVCWECTYPELMPNKASPQRLNSAKLLPHVPIYRRDVNKPLFNSNHPVQVLEELITELDSLTISSDTNNEGNDLIENYSAFYSLIKNEYHNHSTKTHHRSSKKPWWSSDLDSARKNLRLIQKEWTVEQNTEKKHKLWQKFKKEQRRFNLSTRKAKRQFIKEKQIYFLLTKASNTKKFWKEYHSIGINTDKCNTTDLPSFIIKEDDTLTSSSEETMMTWRKHFESLLNPHDTEFSNLGSQSSNSYTPFDDEVLNRPIDLEEVYQAIAQLEENKAPGPDYICPSIIKDDKVTQYLHRLFQKCFETGIVPPAWLNSTIQPIYKGKGDKNDPNNYRGITLQSCIAKAFAKIINNRLSNYLESNSLLHDEQNGFRKGRCCQDHISSLYFIIENRKLSKQDTYACFVDFRKAFDSVPRELLWNKLLHIGINNNIHASIKALYTNTRSSIKIDNNLSSPIIIKRGVKQGCPLSPTLFNIFINDLIGYLNEKAEGISFGSCQLNALMYADDLVLVADKPDSLNNLLQALNQWCTDNGMCINPDKTKIIHFRHPKKQISNFLFTCREYRIYYTDIYRYLGVEFTEHLSWAQQIESTSISASRAANYLIAKTRSSGALVFEVYTHLYNTLVLPIIGYSSFLWGYKGYSDIMKIQNNLMRSFLGVGRNAPIVALLGDLGWLPITTITKISCIGFWFRLSKMAEGRLNKQIFIEASNLASDKGYKNWIAHIHDIFKNNHSNEYSAPTLCINQSLQYYREYLIRCSIDKWKSEVSEIPVGSDSGGRLVLYRQIKHGPGTEDYLFTMRSLGGRRVMAGLRAGCLPLAVEVGRYTGTPCSDRVCRLCNCGEVEDQHHFLIICHTLSSVRQKLFSHCLTLSNSFTNLSSYDKCKFLLTNTDNTTISLILQMYHLRQSLLCIN